MPGITRISQKFAWDAGGWFGVQLGATIWIAVCAVILAPSFPRPAALLAALFVVPNLLGAVMWYARHRLSAYLAIQLYTALAALSAEASLFVIETAGLWQQVQGYGGHYSPRASYIATGLVFAGIMLVYHRQVCLNAGIRSAP